MDRGTSKHRRLVLPQKSPLRLRLRGQFFQGTVGTCLQSGSFGREGLHSEQHDLVAERHNEHTI